MLQRLFHQHVEQVWCFVHLIVHSTFVVGMIVGVLKVFVVPFFPLVLLVSNKKVIMS